jgi:hypothetical protein
MPSCGHSAPTVAQAKSAKNSEQASQVLPWGSRKCVPQYHRDEALSVHNRQRESGKDPTFAKRAALGQLVRLERLNSERTPENV